MDELYETKRELDEMKHQLYNRILNRIHERIKLTSRQKAHECFCWYVIPEVMIGIPKYDSNECIEYILDKLHDNGFLVRYTHPNLVLISWQHHIPSYVRNEFKKKTGIPIDEKGNRLDTKKENTNTIIPFNNKNTTTSDSTKKTDFTAIDSYKPSGKFIYNADMFNKLHNKMEPK